MRRTAILLYMSVVGAAILPAQHIVGRDYGRSMVIARQGIVATSQTLASQAGAQILAKGGSAIDAAIAANAVLSVTEPMMNGPGGDLFVLYWDAKTGKLAGLNSSGPAPRGLTPQFLADKGIHQMPASGIHSVTVPGAVRGWAAIHRRHGKLPWKELFDSAIAYADQGFPVAEAIREEWFTERLHTNDESARLFLRNGDAPRIGELFRNPDLAHALRLIATEGPDAVYKGEIAAAILATSKQLGGAITAGDLASFEPEWVPPVAIDYRGWKVYELPPNGQGMAALEMLNIMETSEADPKGPFTAPELHKRIEAMKLAYSDLHRYNADPRSHDVPVAALLSKEYARKRAALIDPNKANCGVAAGEPVGSDTTYLTVVDREGNIASWIQSIYSQFGSGVAVKGMGFELHNRGAGFVLDPQSPNVLAGGKRPFHTIIPAFMERGDLHIGFGIMGGANQPLAHAQFVSNLVDYEMNVQQALESPRFTKNTAAGCELSIESRVPSSALSELSRRGHKLAVRREYTQEMGRGQAIAHDSKTGINYAASDPRADGSAIPEPIVGQVANLRRVANPPADRF
ncbi:MAG: gamma-glutamyltransferase [Bryobacterales bacterium]|nr:gamma-glutamyltransferase [Bryobacterales bacterium]MBV9399511.1 gamma-glutamyltransferase [Bryobacterales bacterium]